LTFSLLEKMTHHLFKTLNTFHVSYLGMAEINFQTPVVFLHLHSAGS
jgi:hypothetical protein